MMSYYKKTSNDSNQINAQSLFQSDITAAPLLVTLAPVKLGT